MRFLLFVLLIFCLCTARLDRFFFKANGSFCPSFVMPIWSRCPKYSSETPEQVSALLDQPFTYLTKGKQSFVFLSADKQWVIKFFRLPRYVRKWTLKGKKKSLPFLAQTMEAFLWSQKLFQNETGVLYAHLEPTKHLPICTTLIDRFGHHYKFDLNDIPFAVQKAGVPFFSVFTQLGEEETKDMILQCIQLYANLYDHGFTDDDPIYEKNFGMEGGRPMIIDTGQIIRADNLPDKKTHLRNMTHSLDHYLKNHCPKHYEFYLQAINEF